MNTRLGASAGALSRVPWRVNPPSAPPVGARAHCAPHRFQDAESEGAGRRVGGEGAALEHKPRPRVAISGGSGATGQPQPPRRTVTTLAPVDSAQVITSGSVVVRLAEAASQPGTIGARSANTVTGSGASRAVSCAMVRPCLRRGGTRSRPPVSVESISSRSWSGSVSVGGALRAVGEWEWSHQVGVGTPRCSR